MPLGAQKATLLGAAGSAGGGFKAFGGLMIDWVSATGPNPVPVTGPMRAHIFYGTGKFYVTDGDKDVNWMVVAGGGGAIKVLRERLSTMADEHGTGFTIPGRSSVRTTRP